MLQEQSLRMSNTYVNILSSRYDWKKPVEEQPQVIPERRKLEKRNVQKEPKEKEKIHTVQEKEPPKPKHVSTPSPPPVSTVSITNGR
jgi:hypothetical protein